MGAFAVVVTDFDAFKERVVAAARGLGAKQIAMGFVEYFDEATHCGAVRAGFARRSRYKHQSEWRMLIQFPGDPMDPRVIEVGDLSDITVRTPADQLDNLITVVEEWTGSRLLLFLLVIAAVVDDAVPAVADRVASTIRDTHTIPKTGRGRWRLADQTTPVLGAPEQQAYVGG